MARHAKAMDVYGKPPADILERLTVKQVAALDRYIAKVASNVYGIAFDCGRQHAAQEFTRFARAAMRRR